VADTVQITAGSGTVVGTDEVTIGGTAQHLQRVKLFDGTDGGTDAIPGTAARGLQVDPRSKVVRLSATPVISTTAYSLKDAVGGLMTFANAVRSSGGSCILEGLELVDKDQELADLELLLFDRTITAPTDNAVFNPSDTEAGYCIANILISRGYYADLSTNAVATMSGIGKRLTLNGTDLSGVLVARGTPTYSSTSDLVLSLNLLQDG
jgi:hypothetical protein